MWIPLWIDGPPISTGSRRRPGPASPCAPQTLEESPGAAQSGKDFTRLKQCHKPCAKSPSIGGNQPFPKLVVYYCFTHIIEFYWYCLILLEHVGAIYWWRIPLNISTPPSPFEPQNQQTKIFHQHLCLRNAHGWTMTIFPNKTLQSHLSIVTIFIHLWNHHLPHHTVIIQSSGAPRECQAFIIFYTFWWLLERQRQPAARWCDPSGSSLRCWALWPATDINWPSFDRDTAGHHGASAFRGCLNDVKSVKVCQGEPLKYGLKICLKK